VRQWCQGSMLGLLGGDGSGGTPVNSRFRRLGGGEGAVRLTTSDSEVVRR
jgi:hypothetical protein